MKKKFSLIFQFAIRDFKQKYITTNLGQFWFFLSPIIMISIYTIIFSDIMSLKLNFNQNDFSYSTYLIPGILAWTNFSVVVSSLTNSFESKANLIKKINLPMYIFQLSIFTVEFLVFLLSIFLATVFLLFTSDSVTITFLWMLPIMFLQMIFAFSLGVILSLFTPFFKDIKVAVPLILRLWFWLTPIVYLKELVVDKFPNIFIYNPLYYFIDIYHNIFVYSKAPNIDSLLIIFCMSFLTLFLAAYLYKKMISTIKDII